MPDPLANAQLELACRLGSVDDVLEALDDGADVDCNGSSPLFIAIMANDRRVVETLVRRGADTSIFGVPGPDAGPEAVVDALMAFVPVTEEETGADPVDAKVVRAFDRMIRVKGLGEPLRKGRGADYAAFADGLKWIASEECLAQVGAFLALLEEAVSDPPDAVGEVLERHAGEVDEWSRRYREAEEDVRALLKEYQKERRRASD